MAREKTKCMTSIGGQALIEGIMMRGPQKTAVAVRLPDNTIETEYLEIKTLRDKYPLFRAPLLRGIAGFIDSLSIGYRALMLSAEKSDEETGEEEMSRFDAWIDRKFGDKAMKAVTVTGTVLGVALAVVGALKGQLKQTAQQSAAGGYVREGSFRLDVNADHFFL